MPGLLGVYSAAPEDLKGELERMMRLSFIVGSPSTTSYHWPGLSVAVVACPGQPPVEIIEENKVAVIEGWIDSSAPLHNGRLDMINGHFFGFLYQKSGHRIKLFNDPLGLHPHFIRVVNRRVYFAFQIWPLIFGGEKLDLAAIAAFLEIGGMFDNRTFLREVKFFPPGVIVEIKENRIITTSYWQSDFSPRYVDREAIFYALKKAVAKRFRPGDGIMLSGGLDSRLIFLLAPQLIPFTFGPRHCTDVEVAQELTHRYGVRLNVYDFDHNKFIEWVKLSLKISSGLCPVHALVRIQLLDKLRRVCDRFFSGFIGDIILGGTYTNPILFLPKPVVRRWLAKKIGIHRFRNLFDHKYVGEYDEYIRTYLTGNLRYSHLRYALAERIPHHLALGIHLDRSFFEVLLPFIDRDVMNILFCLRAQERRLNHCYAHLLKEFFPSAASLVWARTGYPATSSFPLALLARFRNHYYPKIRVYIDLHRWFCQHLKNWVDSILYREGGFWIGMIGKENLEKMSRDPVVISRLVTIEMALTDRY